MNASSSSDDDDAPGASTWEGEDETSGASGDSNAAGKRALRVEAAATKRLSLSERLRRLDAPRPFACSVAVASGLRGLILPLPCAGARRIVVVRGARGIHRSCCFIGSASYLGMGLLRYELAYRRYKRNVPLPRRAGCLVQ